MNQLTRKGQRRKTGEEESPWEWFVIVRGESILTLPQRKATDMMGYTRWEDYTNDTDLLFGQNTCISVLVFVDETVSLINLMCNPQVVKYWPEKGKSGFLVWRYLMRRDDPTPAPWTKAGGKRIKELGLTMQVSALVNLDVFSCELTSCNAGYIFFLLFWLVWLH